MKPIGIVIAIGLVVVVAGGIAQGMKMKASPTPSSPAPVSDCEIPELISAPELIGMVSSRKEELRSEFQTLVGCMVSSSGWTGQVTSVEGQTVTFEYGSGLSAYSVVVLMKAPHTLAPGASVRYRGRLDGASARIVMGNVMNRVDLSQGELVN